MADVVLQNVIRDVNVARALAAFNTITGCRIVIKATYGSPNLEDDFNGHWGFIIQPKEIAETNIEFGERCLRELGVAIIRMVELETDQDRYNDEIVTINPPSQDVPSDVIE